MHFVNCNVSDTKSKMLPELIFMGVLFCVKLNTVNTWNIPVPGENYDLVQAINKMTVELISKCYSDNREIIIHGDSEQSTIKLLRESETFAVMIYNNETLIDNPVKLRLHHNTFITNPHSITQLERMFRTFRKSQRWNVMAPHFILDKSNMECRNAKGMLEAAWRAGLVKTFFLCVDSNRISMIYTYNPYTNRAPKPWESVPNAAAQSNGWTMLYQHYDDAGKSCESINFDRTKHLDGSKVRIALNVPNPENFDSFKDYNASIKAEMYKANVFEVEMLEYSLNITPIFNIITYDIMVEYLRDEEYGPVLISQIPRSIPYVKSTHIVDYKSYHIVVNNRGFYTPLEKIWNFYGIITVISMLVILSMTFIVIIFSETHRRWAFAAFEVLRLVINAALHSRMDTWALRIFFSMVFLYFLIIQATFQGHLSAFLTKQESRRNAETLNDLRDARYEAVHIQKELEKYITDPIIRAKLVPGNVNCIEEVIGNDAAACICTVDEFIISAFEHELHVSENPVFVLTTYHLIKETWPLEERYNSFLMWLESSGQSCNDFTRRYFGAAFETQKRESAKFAMPHLRPISVSMLDWILIFWLIGLKLAAMTLTAERRIRPETIRRRENERAVRENMERRRREIINRIISDPTFTTNSRPHSI